MKNEIYQAYERMNPPREVKERMMRNIQKKQNRREHFQAMPTQSRSWAAIPAALLLVILCGMGVLLFLIPQEEIELVDPQVENLFQTDYFLAAEEWYDYVQSCGVEDAGYISSMDYYTQSFYGCKTADMEAALHDWTEKHGIGLYEDGTETAAQGLDSLLKQVNVANVYSRPEGVSYTETALSYFTNGDFNLSGSVTLGYAGSPRTEAIEYTMSRVSKDKLHPYIWQSGHWSDYEIWTYTSESGQQLTVAQLRFRILIFADLKDQLVVLAIHNTKNGEQLYGGNPPTKEVIEAFADCFDYSMTPPEQAAADFSDAPEEYRDILRAYSEAVNGNWGQSQYASHGLNRYITARAENIKALGYCLMDLNSDGVTEMLITDGYDIFEIYRIREGKADLLREQTDMRIAMYLVQNDRIYTVENGDRYGGVYHSILRYGPDVLGNPNLGQEAIVFVTADGQWYAGPYEKDAVKVTEAEAMDKLEAYQAQFHDVRRFDEAGYQESLKEMTDTIPQAYAHVLDKYVRAYQEDWSAEEYMQNDISYMMASKNIYWQCGYALIDLTGDGRNELVITDGEAIYDVYNLMDDGGAGHIISATDERSYFLCKDNIIGCQTLGAEGTSWDFFRLLVGGDSEIVLYVQKYGDTWYKIEGRSDAVETISHDEVDEIIGSTYRYVKIPFQTFLRAEEEPESEYPRVYVQLLRELTAAYSGSATMDVAFADVTGDGEEEMLLGIRSNDSFGHVYSVVDGQVEKILTYGIDIDFTLCKNGVICYHDSGDAFGNYVFISLKNNEYKILETLAYDEDRNCWMRTVDDKTELITDAKKQEIIESYGSVSLEWVSVAEVSGA